jgi:8-oxo-dGTP pyrophosphatase MutT (NUDIX family)
VAVLRHRYQAAVLTDGKILLLQCAFRDGPIVWILPGGGRDEDESDDESRWRADIRNDVFLYPQLVAIRAQLAGRRSMSQPSAKREHETHEGRL